MGAEEVRPELPGLGKVSDTWSPPAADNYPSKLLVHTRDENGEGGNVPQQVPSGHAAGKRINLNSASVTSVLALYPNQSPQKIARILFPTPSLLKRIRQKFILSKDLFNREEPSAHRIQLAYQSGRWSTHEGSNVRPSELFLKMFSDVLLCLDRDRLSGFVSPSLIATCGVMPLTILSTISDIMRHYYECVVQAKHEVLVSTFYFWKSEAQLTFSRALFELSKRVEARQQKGKVVIKCTSVPHLAIVPEAQENETSGKCGHGYVCHQSYCIRTPRQPCNMISGPCSLADTHVLYCFARNRKTQHLVSYQCLDSLSIVPYHTSRCKANESGVPCCE
ncbi:hypothetical protein MJO29_014840 [Puccinia striiformis f. sp. tritici]|nr:hypothetical protein MJO29_014840 [Puccinia striiformis f. sp. tritici]